MSIAIDIHTDARLRVMHFMPGNSMSLTLLCKEDTFTLYGLDPVRAWALFDLFRDDQTSLHWGGQSAKRDEGFVTFGMLMQAARDATLAKIDAPEVVS